MKHRHSHHHSTHRHHPFEAIMHMIGRQRSRHGFGPRGGHGHDHGDGDDNHELSRGRKFSSDDLQLMLLLLLNEKPAHGYELIKALESRSNGYYVPSPGMIYPALTLLEEIEYVAVNQVGNRKSFSISELGKEYLSQNQERADYLLARLTHFGRKMDAVRRTLSDNETLYPVDSGAWLPEFIAARHALRTALVMRSGASQEEQRRIAEILNTATQQILAQQEKK